MVLGQWTQLGFKFAVPYMSRMLNNDELKTELTPFIEQQLEDINSKEGTDWGLENIVVTVVGGIISVTLIIVGAVLASPLIVVGGLIAGLVTIAGAIILNYTAINEETNQVITQQAISEDETIKQIYWAEQQGLITHAQAQELITYLMQRGREVRKEAADDSGTDILAMLGTGAGVLIIGGLIAYFLFTKK